MDYLSFMHCVKKYHKKLKDIIEIIKEMGDKEKLNRVFVNYWGEEYLYVSLSGTAKELYDNKTVKECGIDLNPDVADKIVLFLER